MTDPLDLQRKVQRVEGILKVRQDEVHEQKSYNHKLSTALQQSNAEQADINSTLLSLRLAAAQLMVDNNALLRAAQRADPLQLAEDIAGVKSHLSSRRKRQEKVRLSCAKELDRMSYFKQLVQSKMRFEVSHSSTELLNQINQRIQQQREELAVSDLPQQAKDLHCKLNERQQHLTACQCELANIQRSCHASRQKMDDAKQKAQELHEQQMNLNKCRQQLQQLSWEVEKAADRLAGHKAARMAADGHLTMLQHRIAEAKASIFQLIG